MPARLTEIEIDDFRAIRGALRLSLVDPRDRPLARVVLAGPNGCGKTSVLEAILLALGREALIVRDLPATERADHWRVEVPRGATVRLRGTVDPADRFTFFGRGSEFEVVRTADRWEARITGADGQEIVEAEPAKVRAHLDEIAVEYFSSWRAPLLPGGLQPTASGRPPRDTEANRLRRIKQRVINERARRAFAHGPQKAQDLEWLQRINAIWSAFHSDGSTLDADVERFFLAPAGDPRAGDPAPRAAAEDDPDASRRADLHHGLLDPCPRPSARSSIA